MMEGRLANAAGAVLLGGASSRMGADKALLSIGGTPLATRLATGLATLFEDVLLVGGSPPADARGRRIRDPEGPRCALRGLVGALEASQAEKLLVVATDLPGLTPDVVLALLAAPEADAVVPLAGNRLQPLCALYRVESTRRVARALFDAGRLALHGVLEALAVQVLGGSDLVAVDPEEIALANVNTPESWRAFEARSRQVPSW